MHAGCNRWFEEVPNVGSKMLSNKELSVQVAWMNKISGGYGH